MDKPLKDWTLGEVVAECNAREECYECPFFDNSAHSDSSCRICAIETTPVESWNLSECPRFTEQEVEEKLLGVCLVGMGPSSDTIKR